MNAAKTHTSRNSRFRHYGQNQLTKSDHLPISFNQISQTETVEKQPDKHSSLLLLLCLSLFWGLWIRPDQLILGSCRNHISLESATALKHTVIQLAAMTDWNQHAPPLPLLVCLPPDAAYCGSSRWPLCRRGPTLIKTHTFVLLCWQILHFPNLIGGKGAARRGAANVNAWLSWCRPLACPPSHAHALVNTHYPQPPATICVTVFEKCCLTRLKWANALCWIVNTHRRRTHKPKSTCTVNTNIKIHKREIHT